MNSRETNHETKKSIWETQRYVKEQIQLIRKKVILLVPETYERGQANKSVGWMPWH